MQLFDYQSRTRFIAGIDAIDELGPLAREWACRRALVVSDAGVVAAGHTSRGLNSLQQAGLEIHCFDGVHENPTTEHVDAGTRVARDFAPDLLIGLGGGSSMDCAKGINFLLTNGGRMSDYWGVDKAALPMLPMIAVPTTAGTGSEAQSFALISDAETHVKMACGDAKAAFRAAILDPQLTVTQPHRVTALTGIDALSHAIESHVTTRRNPISTMFSREAFRLLATHLHIVLKSPEDLTARANMQLGACLAGLAIENSMLGATHALANPLTASFDLAHGEAIGIMLPHVIRFNASVAEVWYQELLHTVGDLIPESSAMSAAERLADFVSATVAAGGVCGRLQAAGITPQQLASLASAATSQWTGQFNPRPVNQAQFSQLYQQAL